MSLFLAIHAAWCLAALGVVVRQKRMPAAAAAWWLAVVLLPVAGTLLYLLAGWRPYRPEVPEVPPEGLPLEKLVAAGGGSPCAPCNRVALLHNGNNAFSALIAALQHASHSIHMEYYIFRDDRIGRTIADILMRKARSGVEVRVLYDAVGSWSLDRGIIRHLRLAGAAVHSYAPLRFPWFTPRAARRNHRKIVVVDGRVAFLGGINIAKYYLDGDNLGRWRDEHLRIEGDAVGDLQRIFAHDWAAAGGRAFPAERYVASHDVRERLPVQIVRAEEGLSRPTLMDAYAAAILRARHTVRISSPYIMPPPLLLDALRIAVRSGVRVAVMTPSHSDSRFTDLISESFAADLLDAGVELYLYENGFLHAKLLVVDDRVASVGTANMDYRSLEDNLEVTAFLYGREAVAELSDTFDRDLTSCVRATREMWCARPQLRRLAGDVLRPLAPLL